MIKLYDEELNNIDLACDAYYTDGDKLCLDFSPNEKLIQRISDTKNGLLVIIEEKYKNYYFDVDFVNKLYYNGMIVVHFRYKRRIKTEQ